MIPVLLLPLAVATVLSIVVTTTHRRLPPRLAARAVATTLAVVAIAAVSTFWIIGLGYVAHLPVFDGHLKGCANAFGVHDPIHAWIGVPALCMSILGVVRSTAVVTGFRRLRDNDHPGGIEIASHELPFAFTLPGKAGHIVLSSALATILDDAERDVVLAHEHAHADHRHDRYLLVGHLAAGLMPLLRPLLARLQFSLERWADENAVAHCGDRRFVARTLGKVALRNITPAGAIGFSGLGVPARVAALLSPPTLPLRSGAHVVLWAAIGLVAFLAALQIHHLADFLIALCP